jgi:transcriptional regulator with XRE-family HTH domain
MKEENEEFAFNEALRARLKALREGKGWTAEQMAEALGIPPDRYRKYESRSPAPQYLIPRIALIMDKSIEYILTGKDKKPPLPSRPSVAPSCRSCRG